MLHQCCTALLAVIGNITAVAVAPGVSKNHDASMEKKQNEIKLLQAEREQYKAWKKRFDDGKKCKDAEIEVPGGNGEKKELKPPPNVESVR